MRQMPPPRGRMVTWRMAGTPGVSASTVARPAWTAAIRRLARLQHGRDGQHSFPQSANGIGSAAHGRDGCGQASSHMHGGMSILGAVARTSDDHQSCGRAAMLYATVPALR